MCDKSDAIFGPSFPGLCISGFLLLSPAWTGALCLLQSLLWFTLDLAQLLPLLSAPIHSQLLISPQLNFSPSHLPKSTNLFVS